MRTSSWVWVPSFVLLAASPASAGAIILSDIRAITGSVHEFIWSDTAGETRFDDTFNFTPSGAEFTASYSHFSQFSVPGGSFPLSYLELTHSSIVSRDHIAASGDGRVYAESYEIPIGPFGDPITGVECVVPNDEVTSCGTTSASASINMNVEFQLATSHTFDLNANLSHEERFNDWVHFSLCGSQGCLMDLLPRDQVRSSLSGVLDPGLYTFLLEGTLYGNPTDSISWGAHRYNVDLQLTPVPEPGTMALFTVGLGILVSRRRNLKGLVS